MSMELLTFLQLIYIIAIYLGVVVLIPAAVFHGKFEDHPFYVRYTAYTCIGNFYLMNLVFLLQLLHISSRATLILGVVLPALIAIAVYHWQDWVKTSLVQAGETTHNIIVNTMGVKLFFTRISQNLGQAILNTLKAIVDNVITRWFDWIGTIAIIIIVCWQYGTNLFSVFGYTASDMLVHNYWINAMGDNNIFAAGVYPYGFHAIIYFFHAVFGIETYVMLRLFSLLETMLIHFVLLFLLRLVCKTDSAAYIATGIYLLLNIWGKNAYYRFYSALPQEYGMIFILPSVFFLILFFRERLEENGEKGLRGKKSTTMLKLFGINVSMTLAVHFYDTIALGIICVAIAIGFCKVVFRKDVIGRVMAAGVIGIIVAIFPMWFAYFCGTPLEGSLRWGMAIMGGYTEEEPTDVQGLNQSLADPLIIESESVETASLSAADETLRHDQNLYQISAAQAVSAKGVKAVHSFLVNLSRYLSGYVFIAPSSSFGFITLIIILMGFGFGALSLWRREYETGRMLLAASITMVFFCIILSSRELGIPVLMDKNRTSIYLAYCLIILLGLVLDQFLGMGMVLIEGDAMKKIFPTLIAGVCFVFLGLLGWVRTPAHVEAFQKNGAIICVENIIRENAPQTFNIISANDEMRMVEDYGYHFEVSTLLIQNMGNNAQNYLEVPSSKVYVFIEKIPGVYDAPYEGSGKPISRESASKPLPFRAGFDMYKGQNRHVIMSKLYFWAQTFGRMYENEMSVYYEDDEFVCYEIRQNVDRPYDMSFDYGYNN